MDILQIAIITDQGAEMKLRFLFTVIVLLAFMSACATIEKTEVEVADTSPKISKTIEQQAVAPQKGLKRKVAIARFTNETKYGQSFLLDQNDDRVGKQAVDILSGKLLETEKFIILERADLVKIQKELEMGDFAPLKNSADYLIIGSVTEFGRKEHGKVGIFSRTKKQVAFAKVHIRMIDVYTGEVIYSENGEGEAFAEAGTVFGVGARAGYDSSLNDKAIEAAINNLSSNIIENLLDKPWRGYILGYEDGTLIISGGRSQNISVGDAFQVIKEGKKVKNPQTNMYITLPGKPVAKIKVVSSLGESPRDEVSLCEIVQGDMAAYLAQKQFHQLYIREIPDGDK
jgi:curli biogenesis system outer membrane secretion channel CsgG